MTKTLVSSRRVGGELRRWPRHRWYVSALVAATVLLGLGAANGLIGVPADIGHDSLAPPPARWWYPFAIIGAGLVGLIFATYRGAPIGAAATFCDLRWPILGIAGVAFAGLSSSSMSLIALAPGTLGVVTRLALGLAALALLVWALLQRLAQEQEATVSDRERGVDPGNACSTCRPISIPRPSPHQAAKQ